MKAKANPSSKTTGRFLKKQATNQKTKVKSSAAKSKAKR